MPAVLCVFIRNIVLVLCFTILRSSFKLADPLTELVIMLEVALRLLILHRVDHFEVRHVDLPSGGSARDG